MMDLSSVFQCVIDQMDAEDMLDTAHAVLNEVLVATPNPPPPPPAPPSLPTPGYVCGGHPQPVDDLGRGYDGYITLETVSLGYEQPLAPALTEQPAVNNYYLDAMAGDMYSQGQYLPCQWPEYDAPGVAAGNPVDPDVQVLSLPQGFEQNLTPAGIVNGEVVYEMPEVASLPPVEPASSHISIPATRKKKYGQQDKNHPYVKKPPNAFMLYMKEQRANVVAELASSDNALVNTRLGQRWRSLTGKDQDKYYKEAERLRKLHAEKYPWWSPRDNYGKKRKRIRRKYPTVSDEEYEDII